MSKQDSLLSARHIVGLFLIGRLILLMALPLEGIRGYGDYTHFYQLARLGRPFLDIWVEFPPVFPFFSRALLQLAAGREHVYQYLLFLVFSAAQSGSLIIFHSLVTRLVTHGQPSNRFWIYFSLLLTLPYGWWYFDPLAVLAMLLGVWWIFEGKGARTGVALGIGALIKWFPALALPAVWRMQPPRRALIITAITLGLVALVLSGLFVASPDFTLASLQSQASKGSWETIWALVDGNLMTGNFGPEIERYDPQNARKSLGNPPKISPWLTLIPFGLAGFWLFRRTSHLGERQTLAFLGVTWCVYLLWSPGWSPQWILYLLPLILLTLPEREAILMAVTLTLLNLLEWPLLLARGYFWGLWLTIPVRTLLLILLLVSFWRMTKSRPSPELPPAAVGETG